MCVRGEVLPSGMFEKLQMNSPGTALMGGCVWLLPGSLCQWFELADLGSDSLSEELSRRLSFKYILNKC